MPRCTDGDAWRERCDRLVADVLVDVVRRLPQRGDVDIAVETETGEGLGERLSGDTVQDQRDWEDRTGNELGPGARGFERRRQRVSAGALAVDSDRQTCGLPQACHELPRTVRLQ